MSPTLYISQRIVSDILGCYRIPKIEKQSINNNIFTFLNVKLINMHCTFLLSPSKYLITVSCPIIIRTFRTENGRRYTNNYSREKAFSITIYYLFIRSISCIFEPTFVKLAPGIGTWNENKNRQKCLKVTNNTENLGEQNLNLRTLRDLRSER